MAANLFLTSAISFALGHLTSQICDEKRASALSPITIMLPTSGAIQDLRYQLGDTIGVQMCQFYHLSYAVLNDAGIPIHEINDTAIRRLIKRILGEMNSAGKLTSFSPVWEKPGFVDVILDWVREMKSQGIFPEHYDEYAKQEGTERDTQLADLYLRYQAFMHERNYSDADGLLWLAAEALEDVPDLYRSDGSCFVLGFDQFSPVQMRILAKLAERFREFAIYLLWDPDRTEDSLALSRLTETRKALEATIPLEIYVLEESLTTQTALSHVRESLFESDPEKIDSAEQVLCVEAPSREDEVRWTLREVKRLMLGGIPAHEITLLTPNPRTYTPIVRTVADEYDVPVKTERHLRDEPLVATLKNLLRLAPEFPWRLTFDALRSPYIQQPWLTPEQVNLLDQLSRERPVMGGREQWAFALTPLEIKITDPEDEELSPPPLVAELPQEVLNDIQAGLDAFFDHLTPIEISTYREYTWWIQTAILGLFPPVDEQDEEASSETSSMNMVVCAQEGIFAQRDQKALTLILRAMRNLMASAETIPGGEEIPWKTYRDEFIGLIDGMRISPDVMKQQVRFAHLADGRARTIDYLFVLGLSEGEFPTPPEPDVLYAPSERQEHSLPLFRPTPADEASLWWQVVSNCQQRLTMLRPYIDENGSPWQPSPYWDAILACLKNPAIEKIPIALKLDPDQTASHIELLTVLATAHAQTVPELLQPIWQRAHQADDVMKQRDSYQPPSVYEGVMQNEAIKVEFAQRFDDRHIWSASRLYRYADCPHGFFAQYVLELKPHQEPEEGMDALQRGSVLHAVLEQFNQQIADSEIPLIETNLDDLFARLDQSCELIFSDAPQRYGFRPGALWKYEQFEFKRMLKALIRWECEENGATAQFIPYMAEAGFGIGSDPPPLEIISDELTFRMRGLIDRVDIDPDGNLRVIDYKSGRTRFTPKDQKAGLAPQTALYAYAAEMFWAGKDTRVLESYYLHIPSREKSGKLTFGGPVREEELVEISINQAAAAVGNIRDGIFPSAPAKPLRGGRSCRERCEFASICRVNRKSISKARLGGLT